MQTQIQALLAGEVRRVEEEKVVAFKPNTKSNVEVTKLQIFNKDANKVLEFLLDIVYILLSGLQKKILEV